MSVSKWVALCAIAGMGLASSTASAAPKKARSPKASAAQSAVIEVDALPDAKVDAKPVKKAKPMTGAAAAQVAQANPPSAPDDPEPTDEPEPAPLPPPEPEPKPEPAAPGPETVEPADKKESPPSAESLAVGAPKSDDEASVDHGKLTIRPYLLVSGGLKADIVKNKPGDDKNNRVSTFALGRLGIRARWLDFVYAESELMASGGIGLHGTSAYEGQAAMQVRQQRISLSKAGFRVDVGRIIDEASVDYFSAHVAETFLQDTAVRDPLLFSGFNLGNGVRAQYEILPGLRAAFTFNAGNPVSNTASLLVGGAYPPFDRFYGQPYQQVSQSANNFPDDTFHTMVFTPSVLLDTEYLDVRVALQGFDINVNTTSSSDDHIRGYNARGTAKLKLFENHVIPFASTAYTRNDTLVATDLSRRSPDRYQAVNLGGGIDFDILRRFKCSHDCADGFGAQYQQVSFQIGEGLVTTQRYFNLGATYWLAPNVSLDARFAMWMKEQEQPPPAAAIAAGQRVPDTVTEGERSLLASLRFIMP